MTEFASGPADVTPGWLENLPIPAFAIVMGLSGLTLALHAAAHDLAATGALVLTVAVFAALGTLYGCKAVRHRKAVLTEWRHPVKLAFFPAVSISMLLVATALRPDMPGLARVLWIIGATGQAALTLAVLSNWIGHRQFQPIHISPAWFIPAVGNIVAPVAGVTLGFQETSWLFFSAGLVFWIVLLVLVMNRLIFHDPLPGKMVPTLAILIAPPAVGFLAWLQLNGGSIDAFGRILFNLALVFCGLALTQVLKLRGLPFALSWWALSFPLAALAIASLRYGELTNASGFIHFGTALVYLLGATIVALILQTVRGIVSGALFQPD